MDIGDIRTYKERWKAVKEIEQWGIAKYSPIERILIILGFKTDNGVDNMQIILRWTKLKNLFEDENLMRSK